MKLAKEAHTARAKSYAASQFLKLKLEKANALAAKQQKSRDTMDAMLTRSRQATEAAMKARDDAIGDKRRAEVAQGEADDLREEAMRIADECAFLLAKNNVGSIGWRMDSKAKTPPSPLSQQEEPITNDSGEKTGD